MAESELKNYDDFVMDTSSTKKRAIKVAFKARRTCVRKVTLALCVGFLVLGICMIVFGASIQKSEAQQFVKGQIAVAIIVIGVFVLIIGCVGIVGALMDHKGVVLAYQALLSIFFIVQVVLASLTLADSSNASALVESGWNNADYNTRLGIQTDFFCCGLWGTPVQPTDGSQFLNCTTATQGIACSDQVVSSLKDKYWPAGFVCLILVLLQIAGLVFGCWMMCGKKEAGPSDLTSKRKRKQEAELTSVQTEGTSSGSEKKKGKKKKDKAGGELR